MRTWIAAAATALVLCFLAAGLARAGDLSDPVWSQAPDRSDWAKAYPVQAAAAGISGAVKMRCAAAADGSLQNCAVVEESPTGEGFGAAALSLAPGMALKPTDEAGQSIAGRNLIVPVKFEPALLRPGAIVTNPDWLRKPSQDEVVNYYPADANAVSAKTRLVCVVTNRGLLEKCAVTAEAPTGRGFGAASLGMSQLFVMRPMTVDGLPVGGSEVVIPINFQGGAQGLVGPTVHVLRIAPWRATPTADALSAAFPRNDLGKVSAAHVVLRCAIRPEGSLTDCDTISEEPDGRGFANAARNLVKDFRVITNPKVDKLADLRVDVPIDFHDPSRPVPPIEVYDPLWLRSVDPDSVAALFPQSAVKAGYKTGRAVLNCAVAHEGTLNDCRTVSEDPAGFGFADAALKIASVMEMNPWTVQGAPVDGARITLPIRIVLPDEPAPAPAAASAVAAPKQP